MKLLFADESSDQKFKDYSGICVAIIDASKYSLIKKGFNETLIRYGWDPSIEFKGSLLFSVSRGDSTVDVETRIQMAYDLLKLNVSETNSRIAFHYIATQADPTQFDTVYIRWKGPCRCDA